MMLLSAVVFVVVSALIGYGSHLPSSSSTNSNGFGVASLPIAPEVNRQPATFSGADAQKGSSVGSYSTSFGGRMVEQQGFVTVQVGNAKGASDQATRLAASLGGYVAASSFDTRGSSASLVLRVPQANFSSAMQSLANLGTLKAQSVSSNDVTEQYVNLQAQLDSYLTEKAALLRILNSSSTVKDALDAENTIQNVQSQINTIEGQLNVMQRLVTFATVNLQFTEPPANPTLSISEALNSALAALYTVTEGMLILGASIVPIALLGGVVYVPYRHFTHRRPAATGAK